MAKFGTITFQGKSGNDYSFTAYSRDNAFSEIGAVYFVTQRTKNTNGRFSHKRIYVGETGDLSDRPANHHRAECFDRENANCVCVYVESDEASRLTIEADIRENYNPICNQE